MNAEIQALIREAATVKAILENIEAYKRQHILAGEVEQELVRLSRLLMSYYSVLIEALRKHAEDEAKKRVQQTKRRWILQDAWSVVGATSSVVGMFAPMPSITGIFVKVGNYLNEEIERMTWHEFQQDIDKLEKELQEWSRKQALKGS